jgi:hypothetical protein
MNGMANVGGETLFTAAVSAVICGKLSDWWILAGATNMRVRRGFMVVGSLLSGTFLIASVLAPRGLSVGLLMLAGAGLGMSSANIWAMTQILAGPRTAGRWAGA